MLGFFVIRALRIGLLLAACAGLALTATAPAAADEKCKKIGSLDKPVVGPLVVEIIGDAGAFRVRPAYSGRICPSGLNSLYGGFANEKGKVIVNHFMRVIPITETVSLVDQNTNNPARYVYDVKTGKQAQALRVRPDRLFPEVTVPPVSEAEPIGAAAAGLRAPHTIILHSPGGARAEFRNAWVELAGDRVIINMLSADGMPLTQVWDADGKARSPVTGRIEAFAIRGSIYEPETVLRTIRLDHPDYEQQQLYLPLDRNGLPAPLPPGSIGLFPLADQTSGFRVVPETIGWGVVYAEADAIRVTPVIGSLHDLSKNLARANMKYSGFRTAGFCDGQDCSRFAVRTGDTWSFLDARLRNVSFPRLSTVRSFSDPDAALAMLRDLQSRPYDELLKLEGQNQWMLISSGQRAVCSGSVKIDLLPVEGLERYFRECLPSEYDIQRHGKAVSADAVAQGRANVQAWREKQEETKQAQADANARAGHDPWAAGLAAAQASLNAGYNSFMSQQHTTYMNNLNAYNSGAQNWCCGASPRK